MNEAFAEFFERVRKTAVHLSIVTAQCARQSAWGLSGRGRRNLLFRYDQKQISNGMPKIMVVTGLKYLLHDSSVKLLW